MRLADIRKDLGRSAVALLGAVLLLPVQASATVASELIGVCGEVKAYTPAGAADGSVTLGTRTFVLRAGEQQGAQQNARNIARPNFICLEGVRDPTGAFTEYLAWPPPFPFCGTIRAYDAPAGNARGRIVLEARATYDLPVTAPLALTIGERACVRLALERQSGDGVVDLRERRFEHIYAKVAGICGMVSQWSAAERVPGRAMLVHREAGSITVGTRGYAIARGTEYSLVNAPPQVGSTTCLAGSLDVNGVLVEYGAGPGMPGCTGGSVSEYHPPTASMDGLIRLGGGLSLTPESYRFAIPAGTTMPSDATSGRYCFTLGLDVAGDAVVTGARVPEPGRATAPSPTVPAERAITSLPSTSTSR